MIEKNVMSQLGRSVFTTGMISHLVTVAPRTVNKWFDSGKLRGYRIPGSNDRRITRESLLVFLKEHGMPIPPSLGVQILLVGVPTHLANAVPVPDVGERLIVATMIEAGMAVNSGRGQHVVVLDTASLGRSEVLRAGQAVKEALPNVRLVALVAEDESRIVEFTLAGFGAVLLPPVTAERLVEVIGGKE